MMQGLVTDAPEVAANEMVLAKSMADTLHKHYPGHMWGVNVEGGVANVRNLSLSGEFGFRVRLPEIYSASQFDKQIMRAGGEILERFRVSRGTKGLEQAACLPTDYAGNHNFDR